jgi:hypothetical protein
MTTSPATTYYCDQCGAPYCERIGLLNLALDLTEDGYCLTCLAAAQGVDNANQLLETLRPYIQSRDCFKKPWNAFDPTTCPLRAMGICATC